MDAPPEDIDRARAAISEASLTAAAVGLLTEDLYHEVGFEELGPLKQSLKRFFSAEAWEENLAGPDGQP